MNKLVIASVRKSAGKTSVIVGLGKALGKKVGYAKPLGDRLLYSKKRLWDHDTALMAGIFGLSEDPEQMGIGFDHSKLGFMYDEEGMKKKLLEIATSAGKDKDVLFIEAGQDLSYGSSVHLDALSVAKTTGSKLVVVLGGEDSEILDDATFLKRQVNVSGIDFGGIIVNKSKNPNDFKETSLQKLNGAGIKVLGIIPYKEELTHFTVNYAAEELFAKVITGGMGLKSEVKTVFIGAMSASAALSHPLFQKPGKLIIVSGDRSDMVLAALDSGAVGIVLTNNIVPPTNIVSKADERNVPLLLVPYDTFETAKRMEGLEPLLTKDDPAKVELLARLVKENVNLEEMMK